MNVLHFLFRTRQCVHQYWAFVTFSSSVDNIVKPEFCLDWVGALKLWSPPAPRSLQTFRYVTCSGHRYSAIVYESMVFLLFLTRHIVSISEFRSLPFLHVARKILCSISNIFFVRFIYSISGINTALYTVILRVYTATMLQSHFILNGSFNPIALWYIYNFTLLSSFKC